MMRNAKITCDDQSDSTGGKGLRVTDRAVSAAAAVSAVAADEGDGHVDGAEEL
jgi:hypothetical protein